MSAPAASKTILYDVEQLAEERQKVALDHRRGRRPFAQVQSGERDVGEELRRLLDAPQRHVDDAFYDDPKYQPGQLARTTGSRKLVAYHPRTYAGF